MPLRITFDLEDADLRYFRNNMKQAKAAAQAISDDEILAKAEAMVDEVKATKTPAFVRQRIDQLNALIDMARDEEWALAAPERKNVIAALAYFADPHDMIPDNIPVLGYVDDAIMIELVVSELKHEIDAFNDFCRYRDDERARNRNPNLSRDEYLEIKRRELHSRMRRRRASAGSRSGGSGRTRIRLF
ncbi:MAG: YkvA family protein [Pseudomonadales bacterium]